VDLNELKASRKNSSPIWPILCLMWR